MTEPQSDKHLKTEFRQLRETEMQAAPDFRASPVSASREGSSRRFSPAMQFAFASAVLIAVIASFLNMSRDQLMPEVAETAPPLQQEADLLANLEMPTDFLLDTPWFELAQTTPDFDFDFPQYDIPEDLSDET